MEKTEIVEIKENIQKRNKRGVIVKALRALAEQNGNMLTPYDVVDAARNPQSPLHSTFEWDNSKAGEKYRLMQARLMLTTVKVQFMGERREAFFNATVSVGDGAIRGYFPIERAMNDEDIKRDVLRQAVRELEHAQQKYATLKEMAGVINEKKLAQLKEGLG